MMRGIGLVLVIGCGGISEEHRAQNTPSSNGGTNGEGSPTTLPPRVDCATSSTSHCVSARGIISGWPYDFACPTAGDGDRVHSFFGDRLHCESHDSQGIAVTVTFPSIEDGDLGPGPFDFQFARFQASKAKIEVNTRSEGANLTSQENLATGRLTGTLEKSGDRIDVVYTYSGTFEATWSSCPEGCDDGAVMGTFRSVFAR